MKPFISLSIIICLYVGIFVKTQFFLFLFPMLLITYLYHGLNVLHEACHGNLSLSRNWNKFFAYGFDVLLGMSSHQYIFKHNLHHSKTNIHNHDSDIEGHGLFRFSEKEEWKPIYKYQHLYAPFFYSLLTVLWSTVFDSKRLITRKVGDYKYEVSKVDILIQLLLKVLHYSIFLILPYRVFGSNAIFAYFFAHLVLGLSVTSIFQIAHLNEFCKHYSIEETKTMSWKELQVSTTANFGTGSRLSNFFFGGLNHQVTHHLHPRLSSSKLHVKTMDLKKSGMEMFEFRSFTSALKSHYDYLKVMGINK